MDEVPSVRMLKKKRKRKISDQDQISDRNGFEQKLSSVFLCRACAQQIYELQARVKFLWADPSHYRTGSFTGVGNHASPTDKDVVAIQL